MKSIPVVAAAAHYDVLVGPIEQAAERLTALGPLLLVSEPRVDALHGARVTAPLGCDAPTLLPEVEAAKRWDVLHDLPAHLAERGASRSTTLVALGGGSVGDITGLAASLFKRGCRIVHFPTTLLAQADSAVGGKTAIDAFGEKNVIGVSSQAETCRAKSLDSARDERSAWAILPGLVG